MEKTETIEMVAEKKNMNVVSPRESELRLVIGKVVRIMAHDIRNPLSSLKNIIELQESGMISPEDARQMFPLFIRESDRLIKLVTNIADYTDVVLKQEQAVAKELPLKFVADEQWCQIENNYKHKHNRFINRISETIVPIVREDQLVFIFKNLFDNACKFTENGTITVTCESAADKVFISVTDNGVGIRKEELEKICQPKSTYNTKGTGNEGGSGLGLFFIREIQQCADKEFRLTSEPGKRTTASFEI